MYLEKLSNAFGVSSAEDDVRKIILEVAREYADEWRVDTMGNLFFSRKSRLSSPASNLRVMVTAHMDEVGFMISEVKSDGNLKFKPVGSFDRRVLLGKTLVIGADRIPGVIGIKPIHLTKGSERRKIDAIDSMYIDVGASNKESAKVKPGDFATFATQFGYLGRPSAPAEESATINGATDMPNGETDAEAATLPQQGLVKGKAFDNRAGCAMLLELLKGDYPVDLLAVFTVQEELGVRGAKVAAYTANPDVAFILEATAADDLPRLDEEAELGIPRLGDGPAITVMDRSFIPNRQLIDLLINQAETAGLPYQFKRPGVGGTDGGAIHLARQGVPGAVVSVPTRYIHSPVAVLDLTDLWNTVKLMQATLTQLPDNWSKHS